MHAGNGIIRMTTWAVVALVSLAAATSVQASGNGASSIFWEIQNTGFAGNEGTVVAMRNDGAWPVILDEYGSAYSLFATEGPNPGSNWHQIGSDLYVSNSYLNVTTSPDGRFAVLGYGWLSPVGVISGVNGGWESVPWGTTAIAFDNAGNLLASRRDGTTTGFSLPPSVEETYNIAVSKYGDISIMAGNHEFYELNHLLGTWQYQNLSHVMSADYICSLHIYDSFGRPHFLRHKENGTIEGVHFDTRSASWVVSPIMNASQDTYLFSENMGLANNDDGVVGTAFVVNEMLYYAHKDENADWAVNLVDTDVDDVDQVGIAYDFEGLPVISYSKDGLIHLAYDPVMVTSLGILGDLDHDGFVGITDINLILSQWSDTVSSGSQSDPSLDGFVGIEDLNIVLGNWSAGTPPGEAGTNIPEPAAITTLLLGVMMLRRRPA